MLYWLWIAVPFFETWFIPTHDGEFHIVRIYQFYTMLEAGYLFPRWAPDMNSGYGMPLFIFHYPFPNYVGSVFRFFGASFIDSFQFGLMTAYLVALAACYLICVKQTTVFRSVVITLLFATVPYWFVDLHIRGSIGEVWGIAWIMSSLAALTWNRRFVFTISVFMLCISHNIMAMLGISFLLPFVALFYRPKMQYLCLGVLMAAYFWIPALGESQYMQGLNTATYTDHFPSVRQLLVPSWGSVFSQPGTPNQEISQQIGIIPLILFLLTGILLAKKYTKEPQVLFLFVVLSVALLLVTRFSVPLWQVVTPLQLLQYPWRLLSFVILILPFVALFVSKKTPLWFCLLLLFASVVLTSRYWKPVLYQPRSDEQYINNPNFIDGTSSMGNSFSTIWTGWKSMRPDSPSQLVEGHAVITRHDREIMSDYLEISAEVPSVIEIQRLYYPGWKVSVNNQPVEIEYEAAGTLRVSIPQGVSKVTATFTGTPMRAIANGISIVSFVILIALRLKYFYEGRH